MMPDTDIEAVEKILAGKYENWKFTMFDLMVLGVWSEHGRPQSGRLSSCITWASRFPEKVIDP